MRGLGWIVALIQEHPPQHSVAHFIEGLDAEQEEEFDAGLEYVEELIEWYAEEAAYNPERE